MGSYTLRGFLLCCLLAGSPTWSYLDAGSVEITVDRVKRVSRDEVHFWLKVTNTSDRPVFFIGINWDSGPRLHPVYLQQWRRKEGWKTVVPCLDMVPQDVVRLDPGRAMSVDLTLQLPLSAVCRERNIQLEGRFRFRLEYFESETQTRAYMEKLFSPNWREARAVAALSEPFEIPPPSDP